MTIIGTILPFVIIFIIIAVILLLIKFAKKRVLIQKLNVKWVFALYGLLLLGAIITFGFLPANDYKDYVVSKEEISKAQKVAEQLFEAASEGKRIDNLKIEGVTKLKEWDFPFEGDRLNITNLNDMYYAYILIERKDTNDNRVQITQYQGKTIIQNIDLTAEERPYVIDLEKENLTINNPRIKDIQIGKFSKEMTINQFSEEKDSSNDIFEANDISADPVLYIQVPKDVRIEGNEEEFQFVTE